MEASRTNNTRVFRDYTTDGLFHFRRFTGNPEKDELCNKVFEVSKQKENYNRIIYRFLDVFSSYKSQLPSWYWLIFISVLYFCFLTSFQTNECANHLVIWNNLSEVAEEDIAFLFLELLSFGWLRGQVASVISYRSVIWRLTWIFCRGSEFHRRQHGSYRCTAVRYPGWWLR